MEVEYEWIPPSCSFCKSCGRATALCPVTHAWKEKTKKHGEEAPEYELTRQDMTPPPSTPTYSSVVGNCCGSVSSAGVVADETTGKKRGVQATQPIPQAAKGFRVRSRGKDAGDHEIDGHLGEETDLDLEEEEEAEDHHFNIPIGLGGIEKVEHIDSHATQRSPTPISGGG